MLQSAKELENILACVRLTWDIEGDCLEAGVYEGGSAKEIRTYMNPNKKLYLYDTFEGFKDLVVGEEKLSKLFVDEYCIDFKLNNTKIIHGYFPDSAIDVPLSFAHLDMDTYESTKKGLEYVYPRMTKGGIILIHDYLNSNLKVKEACEGYDVITLGTSQGYIIK
jgi:hypothetical protein